MTIKIEATRHDLAKIKELEKSVDLVLSGDTLSSWRDVMYEVQERAKRRKARSKLNHYLRDNHIERKPCEICGEKAEAHHDDYDKPLQVRWLCFKHHREWHKTHENGDLLANKGQAK